MSIGLVGAGSNFPARQRARARRARRTLMDLLGGVFNEPYAPLRPRDTLLRVDRRLCAR